jgi:TRAP-type C4-dicarboxylate transport system substrate-binding protein
MIAAMVADAPDVETFVVHNVMDQGRPATDLFDMTESGELTACYFSTSYLCERVPELGVLEQPYLFESLADAHAALDGELGRNLSEAVARQTGFEVLGFWDNGFRHLTNRLRAVHGPRDVEGMRVRLQPNAAHAAMVSAWGGTPVPVELSEGIRMIEAGEVDAQENPLANTVAYGVQAHHPHVTMTGHLYGARAIFANRIILETMPSGLRKTLHAAAASAVRFQRSIAAAYERELRSELEQQGLQFVDLTDAERRAFVP